MKYRVRKAANGRLEVVLPCPHCQQVVSLPLELAGGMSPCPMCSRSLQVPGETEKSHAEYAEQLRAQAARGDFGPPADFRAEPARSPQLRKVAVDGDWIDRETTKAFRALRMIVGLGLRLGRYLMILGGGLLVLLLIIAAITVIASTLVKNAESGEQMRATLLYRALLWGPLTLSTFGFGYAIYLASAAVGLLVSIERNVATIAKNTDPK